MLNQTENHLLSQHSSLPTPLNDLSHPASPQRHIALQAHLARLEDGLVSSRLRAKADRFRQELKGRKSNQKRPQMAREEGCCVICWDNVDQGRLPELAGKGEAVERARGEAG